MPMQPKPTNPSPDCKRWQYAIEIFNMEIDEDLEFPSCDCSDCKKMAEDMAMLKNEYNIETKPRDEIHLTWDRIYLKDKM